MVSQAEVQKDLENYQRMQQQLQLVMLQRQQTELQQSENERAQKALDLATPSGEIYRMAGSVLVPRTKDELKKELSEEAETLKLRKEVLEKQDDQMRKSLNALVERLEKAAGEAKAKGKDLFDSSDSGLVSG